ncbi:glutamate--cysteine ligase [Nocardioides sp. CER19]|uniref:carboxylate-amine ligase n=1 Tax=Nocardioides sp. CER19 TaxID=3038538 RepID=UPI00244C1C82|nr:glutamate--cysteine ligase [Nocardioides sp. CER19]MDH2416614.1 glutamate--cysteine ligase [Nocardioides sp. CER19]
MDVRTVGVEEELLLVDPDTRAVSSRSAEVLKANREHGSGRDPQTSSDELDQELFLHQIETRTDPTTDLDDVARQLVAARRTAGEAAVSAGLGVIACGIVPIEGSEPQVSPNERYRAMVETFGETARNGSTCGTHVHVAIDSPEEGIGVIDRIAPWLPVLVAVGANSPFAAGRDTNYASWRSQAWMRWPSAGATEAFESVEGYREAARMLLMTGAARDEGMLYFDARLSVTQPTVEIRVLDACTDHEDAVLAAALVRGLVVTAAREWADEWPLDRWRAELLRASHWRAARMGLSNTLVHPRERELRPAREVLEALVDHVRDVLEEAGDLDRVVEGVDRVLRAGGASRQRAAYERGGSIESVVDDLLSRTEETWKGGEVATDG